MNSIIIEDRYQIGESIGNGAFSSLNKVIDLEENSIKALKQIARNNLSNEEYENLRKEYAIIHERKHPNIVIYHCEFRFKDFYCILMEYCSEGNLKNYLSKYRLLDNELIEWCRQLSSALAYLHSQNIIHRDIKPENILIQGKSVKIADFGLSKELDHSTAVAKTLCGTCLYIAPELIFSGIYKTGYSCKIDIWSMGCVYYEMSESKLLFGNNCKNKDELFRQILSGFSINDISENNILSEILLKMLVKDPKDRISAKELYPSIKSLKEENFRN
ncbi:unnamed protein product [Brachionus calyciflorus]|uniref:Protein kinase domain-containing protein n=1 Tax=Brachionus calyciflorus TaxID=104777 RepID=A0A813MCT6_9BILA|nr:unnamed protein product [Brachionus calyciflorus]